MPDLTEYLHKGSEKTKWDEHIINWVGDEEYRDRLVKDREFRSRVVPGYESDSNSAIATLAPIEYDKTLAKTISSKTKKGMLVFSSLLVVGAGVFGAKCDNSFLAGSAVLLGGGVAVCFAGAAVTTKVDDSEEANKARERQFLESDRQYRETKRIEGEVEVLQEALKRQVVSRCKHYDRVPVSVLRQQEFIDSLSPADLFCIQILIETSEDMERRDRFGNIAKVGAIAGLALLGIAGFGG